MWCATVTSWSSGSTSEMPAEAMLWVDGRACVPAQVADNPVARLVGLLAHRSFDGALVLTPARSVHTVGMRFAIDVAHLDAAGEVLATSTMVPWRVGRRVRDGASVVEAAAGSFARWGLEVGSHVVVAPGAIDEAA